MPQDEKELAKVNWSVSSLSNDLERLRAADERASGQPLGGAVKDGPLILTKEDWLRVCLESKRWSLSKAVRPEDFHSEDSNPTATSNANNRIWQDELESLLSGYGTPRIARQGLLQQLQYPQDFNWYSLPGPKPPPSFDDAPPTLSSLGRPEVPRPASIIWPANPILFGASLLLFPVTLTLASALDMSLWPVEIASALALLLSLTATFKNLRSYGAGVRKVEIAQAAFDEASKKNLKDAEESFRRAKDHHKAKLERYEKRLKKYEAIRASLESVMKDAKAIWLDGKNIWEESVTRSNRYVEELFSDLDKGNFSRLPDLIRIGDRLASLPAAFPRAIETQYDSESKTVVITKVLPNLAELQIRRKDGNGSEKAIRKADLKRLEKSVPCSLALLVATNVFSSDYRGAIDAVCFNGKISHIDPKDGHRKEAIVLSALFKRGEIAALKLSSVDSVTAVVALKGRLSADFGSAAPVSPLLAIDTTDSRLVESRFDLGSFNGNSNLAEMHWEDFEALVREVFSYEFAGDGMEIQVTRASRDGGVDAIAWDSDPIRGGKFVFQAKRYTNVVGLAAVRDLFGVVVHEGANRGILVTTSTFGPDAYRFAEGKPLTLLNGNQLLGLLEKHGYRARIDLAEAKRRSQ